MPMNMNKFDPEEFVTDKDAKKWIAENLHLDSKSMVFFSGMGQGMLFFLTCVLVLGKHLLEMEVMSVIKKKLSGVVKEFQSTLLCSDDITKLGFVIAGKGNSVFKTVRLILMTFNTCCRLAGLHPSWRKVDLHLMVAEYNSFFSQRMRPIVSYLKWLMPVFATRQMNYPELACKDILSACFELFKRGASLSLLKFILCTARIQMIERLKLKDVTSKLMELLNCSYEDLPIELGYVPMSNPLTLIIAGPEYLIYKHISKEMDHFIAGVYSRSKREMLDQDSVLEPILKHRIFLYRQVNKQIERRKKICKELSLDKMKAAKLSEETALLNLDYGCMPATVLTVLHKAHQDVHDPDKDSLSVKSLVMVMGVANKKAGVEGLTHAEAELLLGEKLECHYKGSTGAERFTDTELFAKMMIVKGMKTEYTSHLKLLSYNKRFLDVEVDLAKMSRLMVQSKSNIPYFMRTVHLSGMSVLEELDASTIIMSIFGTGCEVRRMDEQHADSFLSLKTFKAIELLKETLGMVGFVEPKDIINRVLVLFKGHNSPLEAFRDYVIKIKKKLSSMTFTTPLLKKDNCLDLKSTMAMLMLQRTKPGVIYVLKEKADSREDYMHVMSSLCTLVRDSDVVFAKLMGKMQDDGFNMLSDIELSKTHPKELFLKVAWNIYSEGHLSRLDLVRPYRCSLWSDAKNRTCVTDFVNFAVIDDTRLLEQMRLIKITFFAQVSQTRHKSVLWKYILQLKKDKERNGYTVMFEGKKMDDDYGFIVTKVTSCDYINYIK